MFWLSSRFWPMPKSHETSWDLLELNETKKGDFYGLGWGDTEQQRGWNGVTLWSLNRAMDNHNITFMDKLIEGNGPCSQPQPEGHPHETGEISHRTGWLWLSFWVSNSEGRLKTSWKTHGSMDTFWGFLWGTRYTPPFSDALITGWWLGHPSEKYESQLGWLATQYVGK